MECVRACCACAPASGACRLRAAAGGGGRCAASLRGPQYVARGSSGRGWTGGGGVPASRAPPRAPAPRAARRACSRPAHGPLHARWRAGGSAVAPVAHRSRCLRRSRAHMPLLRSRTARPDALGLSTWGRRAHAGEDSPTSRRAGLESGEPRAQRPRFRGEAGRVCDAAAPPLRTHRRCVRNGSLQCVVCSPQTVPRAQVPFVFARADTRAHAGPCRRQPHGTRCLLMWRAQSYLY